MERLAKLQGDLREMEARSLEIRKIVERIQESSDGLDHPLFSLLSSMLASMAVYSERDLEWARAMTQVLADINNNHEYLYKYVASLDETIRNRRSPTDAPDHNPPGAPTGP